MPGLNGLEMKSQAHQLSVKTRVVVLSMYANEAYVTEALRNGASAYVLKESRALDLLRAVQGDHSQAATTSALPSRNAPWSTTSSGRRRPLSTSHDTLTTRERGVLQLVAEGFTPAEIAVKLFISPRTAETHRVHLMNKLKLRSHTDLIRYALKRGILPMEN